MDVDVYLDGVLRVRLNSFLIEKQGLDDRSVELIKHLHRCRVFIEDCMRSTNGNSLKELGHLWTDVQFRLQDAWGFERNSDLHKFWYVPYCTCLKLANEGRYHTGYYLTDASCPVHGD